MSKHLKVQVWDFKEQSGYAKVVAIQTELQFIIMFTMSEP